MNHILQMPNKGDCASLRYWYREQQKSSQGPICQLECEFTDKDSSELKLHMFKPTI